MAPARGNLRATQPLALLAVTLMLVSCTSVTGTPRGLLGMLDGLLGDVMPSGMGGQPGATGGDPLSALNGVIGGLPQQATRGSSGAPDAQNYREQRNGNSDEARGRENRQRGDRGQDQANTNSANPGGQSLDVAQLVQQAKAMQASYGSGQQQLPQTGAWPTGSMNQGDGSEEDGIDEDTTPVTGSQPAGTAQQTSQQPTTTPVPKQAASGTGQASGKVAGEDPLALHNAYRAVHGAPALTWDDSLAAAAQDWANTLASKCAFYHSGSGENLASGYKSWSDVVFAWYDENKQYSYSNPGYSSATGHFTQMVWSGSTRIGCGKSTPQCWQGVVWACHYDPPGNVNAPQYFQQNVNPPQ